MSDELKKTIVVDDRCNNRTRPFPAFIHSALNKPDRKTESEFIYIFFFSFGNCCVKLDVRLRSTARFWFIDTR